MRHVNNDIYKDIANVIGKLMSENGFYWSDIINKDDWRFSASIVLYNATKSIVPIWWDFSFTNNENCDNSFFSKEDDNDFDLQLLIKYIEEYSFENSTEKD